MAEGQIDDNYVDVSRLLNREESFFFFFFFFSFFSSPSTTLSGFLNHINISVRYNVFLSLIRTKDQEPLLILFYILLYTL